MTCGRAGSYENHPEYTELLPRSPSDEVRNPNPKHIQKLKVNRIGNSIHSSECLSQQDSTLKPQLSTSNVHPHHRRQHVSPLTHSSLHSPTPSSQLPIPNSPAIPIPTPQSLTTTPPQRPGPSNNPPPPNPNPHNPERQNPPNPHNTQRLEKRQNPLNPDRTPAQPILETARPPHNPTV